MKCLLVTIIGLFWGLPDFGYGMEGWSREDIAWEMVWQGAHYVDWMQSRQVARHSAEYHEYNPILGRHPSVDEVNRYMVMGAVVHAGVTWALPGKWRRVWQVVTLGLSLGCVGNNYRIGLRVSF